MAFGVESVISNRNYRKFCHWYALPVLGGYALRCMLPSTGVRYRLSDNKLPRGWTNGEDNYTESQRRLWKDIRILRVLVRYRMERQRRLRVLHLQESGGR